MINNTTILLSFDPFLYFVSTRSDLGIFFLHGRQPLPSSAINSHIYLFVCLFVCFVALRPKSTAMVMAGRSVHLTTLFPGQA